MSLLSHLATLSVYEAAAVRVIPVDGVPEHELATGGGLASAFDRHGRERLATVLADAAVQSVVLADGDLSVEAVRDGAGARLRVSWGGDVVVDEALLLHSGASGVSAALAPHQLGSAAFREAHGLRWAYVAGAMAGGIASADLVIAMARDGLLGFFGAGGLPVPAVEEALKRVSSEVGDDGAWGFNLLHNPVEPAVEEGTVDLYLKYGVRRVSASAYMDLTPAIVRYRFTGITAGPDGRARAANHVFAKVSRTEVAEKFLRPPPTRILDELVASGALTAEQAALAAQLPVATDITAEADSGGHTDHRPLVVLLPELMRLRDRIQGELNYAERPRVGAAGGIGTGAAAWGAFAMGADYVLTGSVNQSAVEAGTSDLAKSMLAAATYTDVASGPAPDMFEIGAKVQVLSRGSMYAQRSQKLYDLYKRVGSLDDIPADERSKLERQLFKRPLDEVWEGTREYWQQRDPKQVERAERDGRHKMALTFRWYLGMTSRWARLGDDDRKRDFQMWCGPAMGGFNSWVRGTELEELGNRSVTAIAAAIMQGAADEGTAALQRYRG